MSISTVSKEYHIDHNKADVLEHIDGFKVSHNLNDGTVTLTVHVGSNTVYTVTEATTDAAWAKVASKLLTALAE